jgi:hypothetical protein
MPKISMTGSLSFLTGSWEESSIAGTASPGQLCPSRPSRPLGQREVWGEEDREPREWKSRESD